MHRNRRVRRISVTAAISLAIAAGSFAGVGEASADPAVCGGPDTPPCAGPGPLTAEQQCALIAWRTFTPCNWLGMQVPTGTPGSYG
jgi:hypothetical protein